MKLIGAKLQGFFFSLSFSRFLISRFSSIPLRIHHLCMWRGKWAKKKKMSDQISRGEEFEKKAEKKLSGWGLFGSKYEDAAELFEKAANAFKLAKSCNY